MGFYAGVLPKAPCLPREAAKGTLSPQTPECIPPAIDIDALGLAEARSTPEHQGSPWACDAANPALAPLLLLCLCTCFVLLVPVPLQLAQSDLEPDFMQLELDFLTAVLKLMPSEIRWAGLGT